MKIQTTINEDLLSVNVLKDGNISKPDATYAYYFVKDERILEKIWYSHNTSYVFSLNGQGVYYVTVFCKKGESVITQKTSPIFYFRGGTCPFYRIEEMEMTNCCNLSCANCGTPTAKCQKGFIEDSTVLATLSWMRKGQTLNYHRVGEPLLHKELVKYVKWGVEAGIKPVISTNGLLLSEEKLTQLYLAGLRHLVITLHTEQSWQAFLMCCKYFKKHCMQVLNFKEHHTSREEDIMYFQGKILDLPENQFVLERYGDVAKEYECWIERTSVHTWAGNVPGTRQLLEDYVVSERQKNCYFIQQKVINVRWDGTIVGCCFDIENENVLGNIHDYLHLQATLENYHLCRYCDNNWAVL